MPFQARSSRHRTEPAPWGYALSGSVLGLVLALVFFAPASLLGAGLAAASQGRLQLVDARGTVWSGSARLLLTGGIGSRDSSTLPSRLDWKLRPAWAGVKLQVNAPCCTPEPLLARLRIGWSTQDVELGNATSKWPTAILAGLGTPWNTVQAEGSLELKTQDLAFKRVEGRVSLAGNAQLQALDVSSRLSTVRPMGSYQLLLTGGAAPAIVLSTLSGTLKLSGSGSWVGSRLRFSGVASVDPELVAAFTNLLNIIGRRQGVQSIITLG
jgi:general secretion pathway protein N